MIIKANAGVSRYLCQAFKRASGYSILALLRTRFVPLIVMFLTKLPAYKLLVFVASHEVPAAFIAKNV